MFKFVHLLHDFNATSLHRLHWHARRRRIMTRVERPFQPIVQVGVASCEPVFEELAAIAGPEPTVDRQCAPLGDAIKETIVIKRRL